MQMISTHLSIDCQWFDNANLVHTNRKKKILILLKYVKISIIIYYVYSINVRVDHVVFGCGWSLRINLIRIISLVIVVIKMNKSHTLCDNNCPFPSLLSKCRIIQLLGTHPNSFEFTFFVLLNAKTLIDILLVLQWNVFRRVTTHRPILKLCWELCRVSEIPLTNNEIKHRRFGIAHSEFLLSFCLSQSFIGFLELA